MCFIVSINNFIFTDLVVQQTKIGSNTSIVFQDIRIGNMELKRRFGILEKEIIKVLITAIESCQLIIGSQSYQFHRLNADVNVTTKPFVAFLNFLPIISTLFRAHVFHLEPVHFEIVCVLTLQYGGFSDWSCHNLSPFFLILRCKVTKNFWKKQIKDKKNNNT